MFTMRLQKIEVVINGGKGSMRLGAFKKDYENAISVDAMCYEGKWTVIAWLDSKTFMIATLTDSEYVYLLEEEFVEV
ncbi:hypothetical protein [Paenibacillus contaminans]|uniref:Uncharacterized protein n=1 Tax=Paenibacillus contaminans TaxID=450362 RepID=A0A329MRQ5_9BACL|nr:hypothetical protein [Paenibacillus contaminans]RAV22649.1 hypothetical protein DQG23_00060 [Paenibacillus contaminans]